MPSPGLNQLVWAHSWVSSSVPRSTHQNRIKSAKMCKWLSFWGNANGEGRQTPEKDGRAPDRYTGASLKKRKRVDGNDSDTGESKDGLPAQSGSSGQGCHSRIPISADWAPVRLPDVLGQGAGAASRTCASEPAQLWASDHRIRGPGQPCPLQLLRTTSAQNRARYRRSVWSGAGGVGGKPERAALRLF